MYMTFILALPVIYLVMAAQFESFIHPMTILLSVPPAIAGAMLALLVSQGTLNIYSQIGFMILIGLVTKNAILIVEFANQLRRDGMEAASAIVEASALRLRPILMTTVATILAALPLALATGAGTAGRRHIGLVVIGGLVVSTLLTLFLVPVCSRYSPVGRCIPLLEIPTTKICKLDPASESPPDNRSPSAVSIPEPLEYANQGGTHSG